MNYLTVLKPRLSEKSYAQSESRVYTIDVSQNLNKQQIKELVEKQFGVKVVNVRTANIRGKTKRTMSITGKRYLNSYGKRENIKKAFVTLKEGSSLPFFAAIEEEEQKEQKAQAKIDKAMEKAAEKESKKQEKPKRGFRLKKAKKEDK